MSYKTSMMLLFALGGAALFGWFFCVFVSWFLSPAGFGPAVGGFVTLGTVIGAFVGYLISLE